MTPNPTANLPVKCNQDRCDQVAAYRFTWPGSDEKGICEGHAPHLLAIASAMGLHVQLIPLAVEEPS